MMHLTVDNTNISFSFKHIRGAMFEVRPGKVITDVTECDFLINGAEFSGLAACVSGDRFEKETGRKVALRRAMEDAKLDRLTRTAVWAKYFSRGLHGQI